MICDKVTTTEIQFWNIIISENNTTTDTILLTSSILPPVLWLTDNSDPESQGVTHPPNTRAIHPPPWPWSNPSSGGSRSSGGPPSSVVWSSGAPTATCSPPSSPECGSLCIGLFCEFPCLFCENPDIDWLDSNDPDNPYGTNNPYNPTSAECTTTTTSECSTACVLTASAATASCTETCSAVLACETSYVSTVGTQTLAGTGFMYSEAWPAATLGADYTSSVFAALQAVLAADFPSAASTTITPTTKTTASVSTVTQPDVTITVTPTADCAFWDSIVAYEFEIYGTL